MRRSIVILSAFATPFRSGAEACAEEVPAMLKDQYDFVIVTARMRRDLPRKDCLPSGIPVERIGFGFGFDKWLYPFLAPLKARKYRPHIVHAILETFAGLALYFCQWVVPEAKRVLTLQTTNRSFLRGLVVRSPNRVTAISSVLDTIAKQLGRDDVTRIPNGIDLRSIRNAVEFNQKIPGRILFVGRLEPMKGIDTLLRAFSKIQNSQLKIHVRVVGDGSQRQSLEKLAHDLDISDRVTFTGHVPSPQIYDEYAQAEIFCALSRSEALGNVFLEAQAAGCAVVATRVGGIPEIVEDQKTGLLVGPDNVDAAASALRQLLVDQDLRRRLAENGQHHTKQYDWSLIANQYARVYRELSS